MTKETKSTDLDVPLPRGIDRARIIGVVERAAAATDLYISHIGGYSRVRYPDAVHWHFKRLRTEPGLIDATFWPEGGRFWLIVRRREPQWVHQTAPRLRMALVRELAPKKAP